MFKHSEESLALTSGLFHFPCASIVTVFCAVDKYQLNPTFGCLDVFFFLEEREDSEV